MEEYGKKARGGQDDEVARSVDQDGVAARPTIRCPPSLNGTARHWRSGEHVDYLSIHHYTNNSAGDTPSYLASAIQFEHYLIRWTARCATSRPRSSKHDVYLSWDEWQVWNFSFSTTGG